MRVSVILVSNWGGERGGLRVLVGCCERTQWNNARATGKAGKIVGRVTVTVTVTVTTLVSLVLVSAGHKLFGVFFVQTAVSACFNCMACSLQRVRAVAR